MKKRSSRSLRLLVVCALVFWMGACGGGEEENQEENQEVNQEENQFDPSSLGGTLIESDVERAESGATQEQLAAYAEGQTEFAIEFLKSFDLEESAVFSPYNLAEAMMLAATFDAFTQAEREGIETAVGVDDRDATYEASNSFRQMMDARLEAEQERLAADEEAEERFAYANLNDLWVEEEGTAGSFDLDMFQRYFGVGVRVTELGRDTEKGAQTINEYVEYYTNGLIPELLMPAQLIDVFAVVTTALYVKASWRGAFEEGSEEAFMRGVDDVVELPFMSSETDVRANIDGMTGQVPDGEPLFVSVPLHGSLAFDMIVPEVGTLEDYLAGFDVATYQGLREGAMNGLAIIEMPVFKTDSMPEVKAVMLSDFGVPETVFELGKIGDIIHQSVIDVNETGIEAAAATAVTFYENGAPGPDFEVKVDRPFLYFLRDEETGVVFFAGMYVGD